MAWEPHELSDKHHEIIRLAFSGLAHHVIADQMGMTSMAVSAILRSPLARGEISRLRAKADESLTNIPMKARLINELRGAGTDALRVNYDLMMDPAVDVRVRAGIGKHFLDRVVFEETDDSKEVGYREILRRLDQMEKSGSVNAIVLGDLNVAKPVEEEASDSEAGHEGFGA